MLCNTSLLIWVPIQNKLIIKRFLLKNFKYVLISGDGERKEFKKTAKMKRTTKRGNPNPLFSLLKYQEEKIIKGIIHKVLDNLRVVATSKALFP